MNLNPPAEYAQCKSKERTKPMNHSETLGISVDFEVVQIKQGSTTNTIASVPTEVPLTIVANDEEIATLSGSPDHLREFVYGFLFTSGFIQDAKDVQSFYCDETKWRIEVKLNNPPEPALLTKRLYTSGCGRGVMFSSVTELALRRPLGDEFTIHSDVVLGLMRWLQTSSQLYRTTRGVHTAALSKGGALPEIVCDDIGRHNAVDKVIGGGLMTGVDFKVSVLLSSGRISSDILFKAKRCEIPVVISLGAPTHQAVLLARDMHMTLVGFARGSSFTVFSHPERILI
jgi:FdhD protein